MTAVEDHNWKFAQCFGDKSDSGDVTEGVCCALCMGSCRVMIMQPDVGARSSGVESTFST
ncbi:hypothetical protein BC943DRAFT_328094 [Umbelopsis sp. AD052]|nr:hypothetical protein BC943DRAFT_328094 [Umbelopsis sp. AD052]